MIRKIHSLFSQAAAGLVLAAAFGSGEALRAESSGQKREHDINVPELNVWNYDQVMRDYRGSEILLIYYSGGMAVNEVQAYEAKVFSKFGEQMQFAVYKVNISEVAGTDHVLESMSGYARAAGSDPAFLSVNGGGAIYSAYLRAGEDAGDVSPFWWKALRLPGQQMRPPVPRPQEP